MAGEIVSEDVERYLGTTLGRHDAEVLVEMEAEARERGFPIVGRHVGVTLEILARAVGARRVLELGSGYGYSAYWFSRAVGAAGEVHCTDGDPANREKALAYLRRATLDGPVSFHVGDALEVMATLDGEFDVVFSDIDKGDYPRAWEAARDRIRPGGLYLCDNVLWSGRVALDEVADDVRPGWTEAIREHNAAIAADERFLASILPIRDGVMAALRLA
ncbi:MAG: O-methyltransferase [Actinomycetota bacterium]|nr:O-methyltransferase [Actinomycetota bacterium]